MRKSLGVFVLLFVLAAATGFAHAQTQITTGTIQGTVTDPSGAVVPGAAVEVKNLDTNQTRGLTTDSDGRFVALLLPSGRYTVKVSKQGFATIIQENVNLTVGQAIALSVAMKVSGTAETITVTDTPTVETVKTEASTTLNAITVQNTPILGRKFEDLLTLTPGVSVVQGPDGDEINFIGQRGIYNNVSLDGGDYINTFFGEQVGGQRAAVDITLEAVKEFQVIVTGGSAEFGRTASGVVNVVTKSGQNAFHGSLFHFQRLEALTSNDSQDRPLTDFHREQSGGSLSGPIVKDKAFWFIAVEQIGGNLQRSNLSVQTGATACPSPLNTAAAWTPIVTTTAGLSNGANEALLNTNADCQRLALISFMQARRSQAEGNPIRRPQHNTAIFGRGDLQVTPRNQVNFSYNFNRSEKINETFDVDTYGNSANGIEGTARIQVFNANVISTLRPTILNEGHFTYAREKRPRQSVDSNIPADTAMGFGTTFRFGNPWFLGPGVDEVFWRSQIRDNISWVKGRHNVKFGGEWLHSLNDQTFRGFFNGRYIFDSPLGFLRYASPAAAGGFGPGTLECVDSISGTTVWVTSPTPCPSAVPAPPGMGNGGANFSVVGPLLLYLQDGSATGLVNIPPGQSTIDNEEYAIFVQDKWQFTPRLTITYGLRWEAQIFPNPIVPPTQTLYGALLSDPSFPSDGTLHSQKKMFQPRVGFAWDVRGNSKSVLRANWGVYNARQNMLTQVGSITTNGVQQFGITCATTFAFTCFGLSPSGPPTWPNIVPTAPTGTLAFGSDVRVFAKDYSNPRVYSSNVMYEQEIVRDTAIYVDYTMAKGVHLTRIFDSNRDANGDFVRDTFPNFGAVSTTTALGKSLYRGVTAGVRKRFSNHFQLEGNYVYAVDKDDDSAERDPFTDRNCNPFNRSLDYADADRDIRHKFNFFGFFELPWKFEVNTRVQTRTAQPTPGIVSPPAVPFGPDPVAVAAAYAAACGSTSTRRNTGRKDNEFFSFDWRVQRPIPIGEHLRIIPTIEMFNTTNSKNNINPLAAPGLFNFDGFLRQGVGDPRQVQLAIRIEW